MSKIKIYSGIIILSAMLCTLFSLAIDGPASFFAILAVNNIALVAIFVLPAMEAPDGEETSQKIGFKHDSD